MRERILEILQEIDETVDYESEQALIDDQVLDSFALITLIGELEDSFDIRIRAVDMVAKNLNSVDAIEALVRRLQAK